MSHANDYLNKVIATATEINAEAIEAMAAALKAIKGRVYCIGLGGSLANCIHMAADFRKLCGIDAVAPDNIAELTAWANDEGWEALFDGLISHSSPQDALFILSVGGGTDTVSTPITHLVKGAHVLGIPIFGIVGPNGGETAKLGTHVIKIPARADRVTPHTEAFQAVVWHALVSHPLLQVRKTKW